MLPIFLLCSIDHDRSRNSFQIRAWGSDLSAFPFKPRVSVIIPTLNGAETLSRQIRALAGQAFDQPWEIIIADNGSTDGTASLASHLAPLVPQLKVVDASDRRGRHFAANLGAAAARGELLIFLDDDDEVAPGFLHAMFRALEGNDIVACRFDHESLNPGWMSTVENSRTDGLSEGFGFLPFAAGSGLSFRRSTFEHLRGFDDRMHFCEDVDICWRAQLAGYSIHVAQEAVILKASRTTIWQMFKQHFRFGRARPLLYKIYREHGMPRRPLAVVIHDWASMLKSIPFLRSDPVRARWARRLGRALGFAWGSIRHRALYL